MFCNMSMSSIFHHADFKKLPQSSDFPQLLLLDLPVAGKKEDFAQQGVSGSHPRRPKIVRKVPFTHSYSLSDAVIAEVMGSIEKLGRPYAAFYTAGSSEVLMHTLSLIERISEACLCSLHKKGTELFSDMTTLSSLYRRVYTCIKRPWAGSLRMQQKRGVGAKCVVRRKWHVVSAHHSEKAGIFDKAHFLLLVTCHLDDLNL